MVCIVGHDDAREEDCHDTCRENATVNRRIVCMLKILFVFTPHINAKAYEAMTGVSIATAIHAVFITLVILNARRSNIGQLQPRINPCYVMLSHKSKGNNKLILDCFSCLSLSLTHRLDQKVIKTI